MVVEVRVSEAISREYEDAGMCGVVWWDGVGRERGC